MVTISSEGFYTVQACTGWSILSAILCGKNLEQSHELT